VASPLVLEDSETASRGDRRVEANNFDQVLNTFRSRTPFRPFTVALVNGDRFEVDSPNALVVRDGVAIYVAPGGIPIIFDHDGVNQFIGDLMERTETNNQLPPA
jgi:hypothetical protein